MRRTALRIGTALLFLAVMGLRAQINRGVIEGVVTDPPGAVVAGVDVTIVAIDTNVSMSIRTNSTGYYRVVDLVPGKYRASFEFSGFTRLDINDIEVSAGR